MATPKGMRIVNIATGPGEAVHVYSNNETILLQLRREVATELDVRAVSFKVVVELSPGQALTLAGELATVASGHLRKKGGG